MLKNAGNYSKLRAFACYTGGGAPLLCSIHMHVYMVEMALWVESGVEMVQSCGSDVGNYSQMGVACGRVGCVGWCYDCC